MRRRLRRLDARDWRVIDRFFVAALFVIAELSAFTGENVQGPRVLNALLLGVVTLSFLWRRSHPFVAVCSVLGGLTLSQLVLTPPPDLFVSVVMLAAASYGAGAHLEGRRGLLGLGLAVATVTTLAAIYDSGDIFFPVAFFCVAPWLVGRTLRNHTQLARELAEKVERAEHARAEDERRAIAAERSRIARELHDVLAHSLSVMVVQSGAARRIVDRDPERAPQAAELRPARPGARRSWSCAALFGPVRRGEGEALLGPAVDLPRGPARRARPRGRARRGAERRGRPGRAARRRRSDRLPDRPGGAHEHPQACRRAPRRRSRSLRAQRGRDSRSRTTAAPAAGDAGRERRARAAWACASASGSTGA